MQYAMLIGPFQHSIWMDQSASSIYGYSAAALILLNLLNNRLLRARDSIVTLKNIFCMLIFKLHSLFCVKRILTIMPEVNSTKSLDKYVGSENLSGPLNYESDEMNLII